MVLDQADIFTNFPSLFTFTPGGPIDGTAVADHTIDPEDDVDDILAGGYVTGYQIQFTDPVDPLTVFASARVYLWDSEDETQESIQKELEDGQRLQGSDLGEGISLNQVFELPPPDLGSDATAIRMTGLICQFDAESTTSIIFWRRGPAVAMVGFLAFDDEDRYQQLISLAQRMDERVDGVLASEITASVAVIPTQVALPTLPAFVTPDGEPVGLPEGYDLPAMVPVLDDFPNGTDLASEGPIPEPGAPATYERLFRSAGDSILVGTSEVKEIRVTIGVYPAPEIARLPIDFISLQGVGVFQEGFAASPEEGANAVATALAFPKVGDASTEVSFTFETLLGELQGRLVYFSRGQVRAQLFVLGLPGSLEVADIKSLADLIDQRIQANSP